MGFLRTASTRRLLATIAGFVIAAIGCTAIAVAATSGGPVPPPKPLADAIHDALAASPPVGISAQITFTNNLIGSSEIVGSDPLLTGAGGRLWLTKGHLRLELQSSNGDAEVVASKDSLWIYDPSSDTVYEGSVAGSSGAAGESGWGSSGWYSYPPADSANPAAPMVAAEIPTLTSIQRALNRLAAHLDGLTAVPTDVAGQPAYSVSVSPKDNGSLLDSVQYAWDANRGVPLRFAVYAKGDSNPVLALQATSISYGAVSPSVFQISPPSGATVVKLGPPAARLNAPPLNRHSTAGAAPYEIAPLSFTPDQPATAGGLALTGVRRVGSDAELLTYGSGLGAVEVLERDASNAKGALPSRGEQGSSDQGDGTLALPTETIDGSTATELSTELGTALEFTRGAISYLVLGSVPLETANAVARAL
jgi:outer membrane lipoprotein-sorting protein